MIQLFARFEAASGKTIDEPGQSTRKQALINELNLRRYSQREAEIAQEWILRGGPVRYGSITLADFYPSPKELNEISYDIEATIKKAERTAENKGYDMGFSDAQNQIQPKEKNTGPILMPLTDRERMDFEVMAGQIPDLIETNERLNERIRKLESKKRQPRTNEIFNQP